MSNHNIRFLAEWEKQGGVLMALPYPGSDWDYILDEVLKCYRVLITSMTEANVNVLLLARDKAIAEDLLKGARQERLVIVEAEYNDTWTRDYGPLAVVRKERNRALDFGFNGWGLKFAADKDNLITSRLNTLGEFNAGIENRLNFVLEGGSVESDGEGTLLTTAECLLSPNRNGQWDRTEISGYLKKTFGVNHVLYLNHGALLGDDTDSHIDTLARLAPNETIIYCGPGEPDNPNHAELLKMREELTTLRTPGGQPYNLIELPLPDVVEIDGEILPATYANFLITPTRILMPVYGQPLKDKLATQMMKIAFPDHEVVGIDCTALIRQHGSLHCVTMQLPCGTMAGISDGVWK